jgi:hypothetical protein
VTPMGARPISGRAPSFAAASLRCGALLAGEHGLRLTLQIDIGRAADVDHDPLDRPAGEPVGPLARVNLTPAAAIRSMFGVAIGPP